MRVVTKTEVADGVVALSLADPEGRRLPDWAPGSHVDLVLPDGLTRQYSLCGDRWDAHTYRIGVLREADGRGASQFVHDRLRVGDLVGVGAPRNSFPLVPSSSYLFVASGIGITPLLPMIQQADLLGADWRLLYSGRRKASMAFLDELSAYGERVRLHPRDECGPLVLERFLGEPRGGVKVYCCGPVRLLDAIEAACADWPRHALHIERFVAVQAGPPALEGPFEVELTRTGRTVTVTPDVSVLDAVRGAGADVLSSCGQGLCGTCETEVVEGVPDHRDSLLDDVGRAANDCMYVCVSRSCTPRLVLDL
ncbi:2Fe-2S iron-sulfur cluster-binding protein [Kineococcus sp. LSe6-4]|uniref:2Fe-2S iron-sulfur cluster-binding protein n=1 Tax=Kineococcus halophytocola TaxID=3234027 RepID=A0ABV4H1E5_9ACTN